MIFHLFALNAVFIGACSSKLSVKINFRGGQPEKWWQNTVIYEIYPQSFYDSDGDGYGDLKGIEEKVEYLEDLRIGTVWINPFYKSPLKDNSYDISDYRAIHPLFGTMSDFESMLSTLQKSDIEVICDFVPNHTSNQHEWLKKSVMRMFPCTDYYVWVDAKDWENGNPVPPNGWESIFQGGVYGSAWKWHHQRRQFYYHAFMEGQPDLNLRNPRVVKEMKDILTFWMNKGVKGFRVDAALNLFEDEQLRDESP